MSYLAFFQTVQPQTSSGTTIDGALVILILAIGTAIPVILNSVVIPIGKALIARINTNTDKKVEELGVFKLLKEEVKRLQDKDIENEKTINLMRTQIIALQEDRLRDKQTIIEKENMIHDREDQISKLKQSLQDCIDEKKIA